MKNIYDEYAVLTAQENEIGKKKDELKVLILKEMAERGVEKEVHSLGSFTISKLKKWSYTDKVKTLEEKYKAQKAKEESTGDATYTEQESLRFTIIKI